MGGMSERLGLQQRWRSLTLSAILVVFTIFLYQINRHSTIPQRALQSTLWTSFGVGIDGQKISVLRIKPENIKVVALVFFGRKDRVQILNCYLERNLVIHGGWLDEVHWIVNTDNQQDLIYLHELVAKTPSYKEVEVKEHGFAGYGLAWSTLEPDAIYIKIDDDVVFMADDTIPRMVSTKLAHSEYLVVSANVINSPLMGWIHYHMSAIHPYLPEYISPEDVPPSKAFYDGIRLPPITRVSWQYDQHPQWQGPEDYFFSFKENPPMVPHRWLRLDSKTDNTITALRHTRMSNSEYDTWGNSLNSWAIAAQQHYSFLENLYQGRLDRYKFAAESLPWVTDYQRLSINMIAINSTEILSHLPMDTVDEQWLTVELPKRLEKSVAVDTHGLASHFTFGAQGKVGTTDLLGRYLDYALENVCLSAGKE